MIKKYEKMLNMDATITKKLFDRVNYPWEVLPLINDYILEIILISSFIFFIKEN